ncbi:hypothetical protein ACWEQG_27430 [Microbispora sp. NPDC004025]
MRVLSSTHGSRGDVEPPAAFAARLRERGAEARVCAPPGEDIARRPVAAIRADGAAMAATPPLVLDGRERPLVRA